MKTIEVYDENTMNDFTVMINQIVTLRATEEKVTAIHLSNGNVLAVKKSLNEVLVMIDV